MLPLVLYMQRRAEEGFLEEVLSAEIRRMKSSTWAREEVRGCSKQKQKLMQNLGNKEQDVFEEYKGVQDFNR